MSLVSRILMLAGLFAVASTAWAIPAFPGAEGAGAQAGGGRYGDVYHVTSLDDTNTPGTLRYGVETAPAWGRTIVFDVGGVIWLNNDLQFDASALTVAGQTAPGDGIMIAGHGAGLTNCQHVIFRHVALRLGDINQVDKDAFGTSNVSHSIIDHCSVSWGVDETLSASNTDNLTIQWSIVSEGLRYSYHDEGSGIQDHSYGSLLRYGDGELTLHHNLYAHNRGRNPRVGDNLDVEWANNVVYDGGYGYTGPADEGVPQINYVGNYIVRGPNGPTSAFRGGSSNTQIYQADNIYDGDMDTERDGSDTGWGMFSGSYTPFATRFPFTQTYVESAEVAYERVLNEAGASLYRDAVDTRIIDDVRNMTGGLIDSQDEVGGYPSYSEFHRPADFDTDGDGMSDTWELAHGLDPNVDDHGGDFDNDGYINLEEYLHELAPIPAPKPIVWAGGTGRWELITNWDIPWQPTASDVVGIESGLATVTSSYQEGGDLYVGCVADQKGQLHVDGGELALGNLYLGSSDGSTGQTAVLGGSLKAAGAIVLAGSTSSTAELSVAKDAFVQTGVLTILRGTGQANKVSVEVDGDGSSLIHTTGTSTLADVLDVQVLGDFRPKEGDKFTIIASSDPNGVYFSGNFDTLMSNITLGLPPGEAAFGGMASGADYEVTFLGYTYGDVNGDHVVNAGDLALMGGAWNQSGRDWDGGNFDGKGDVDEDDLALMVSNWMWSLPSPNSQPLSMPLPEPASVVLLSAGLAILMTRRNRQ